MRRTELSVRCSGVLAARVHAITMQSTMFQQATSDAWKFSLFWRHFLSQAQNLRHSGHFRTFDTRQEATVPSHMCHSGRSNIEYLKVAEHDLSGENPTPPPPIPSPVPFDIHHRPHALIAQVSSNTDFIIFRLQSTAAIYTRRMEPSSRDAGSL